MSNKFFFSHLIQTFKRCRNLESLKKQIKIESNKVLRKSMEDLIFKEEIQDNSDPKSILINYLDISYLFQSF